MTVDAFKTIETLMDCIEKLLSLLKETAAAEQAQQIYDEFFGE